MFERIFELFKNKFQEDLGSLFLFRLWGSVSASTSSWASKLWFQGTCLKCFADKLIRCGEKDSCVHLDHLAQFFTLLNNEVRRGNVNDKKRVCCETVNEQLCILSGFGIIRMKWSRKTKAELFFRDARSKSFSDGRACGMRNVTLTQIPIQKRFLCLIEKKMFFHV